MIETIGTENIKLSNKEMDMITQLVIKEEEMETIEKMNKVHKDEIAHAAISIPKLSTSNEMVSKKIITPIVDSKIISDTKIPPIPPTSTTKSADAKKP